MALQVTFIFICAGLTGIQSIRTVEHVAVEVGGTVHIPCHYEYKYRDHVKYLCRGVKWGDCTYEIKTNQENSRKYSINDDNIKRIVTFTFKNLQFMDSDYYWCNVAITGTDDGKQFRLSVTEKGESKLHVDSQWITGYFGDQVTIYFKYKIYGLNQWCRVDGICLSKPGRIDGARVTTNTSAPGLFAVTMSELWQRNTGWYWGSTVFLQMPVFLNVTVRPPTTTIATTTTLSTATATATTTTESTAAFTTEPGSRSVSDYIIAAVIALGLLIFIVVVSLVICHRLKRNMKKTEAEVLSPESADDPIYSNVSLGPTSYQNPNVDKDLEILYSSVNFINDPVSKKVKVKEEDVVYSTLAHR